MSVNANVAKISRKCDEISALSGDLHLGRCAG